MAKKSQRVKFNLSGILLLILVVLFVFFLMFIVYMYSDLKKVEQSMFNLHQQMVTTNTKIDQYSVSDEESAQRSQKFTEATKQWQIYQNSDYHFQFKSPASWGSFYFTGTQVAQDGETVSVEDLPRLIGRFSNKNGNQAPDIILTKYDYLEDRLATQDVIGILKNSQPGECLPEIFQVLEMGLGSPIKNCFVNENILNQKYIQYRYFQSSEDGQILNLLVAVFPREDYYLHLDITNKTNTEIEYFIQSIVFLN
jgi:cell division protein FtsL